MLVHRATHSGRPGADPDEEAGGAQAGGHAQGWLQAQRLVHLWPAADRHRCQLALRSPVCKAVTACLYICPAQADLAPCSGISGQFCKQVEMLFEGINRRQGVRMGIYCVGLPVMIL